MKIAVISLGCAKNTVDSEKLMGRLCGAGHALVDDVSSADAIFVNTCAFIEAARQESIDAIFEAAQARKSGAKLYVTGCLAQKFSKELLEELPEADGFLGVADYDKALSLLETPERCAYTAGSELFPEVPRFLTTESRHCYIKIAEGCLHSCAFCTIPSIRGRFKSRPERDILAEIEALAKTGVSDFTLVAQDTSSYSLDLTHKPALAALIKKITAIPGVRWVRPLYCYPETVTEELLDMLAGDGACCPYIDIPMQHISARVLRDMGRPADSERLRALVKKVKEKGITLRTTLMVGFPGETEEEFEELLDFVKESRFDRLGAFAFSPEDGTRAAEMPNQIAENIKLERLDRLMLTQREISNEINAGRVGTRELVHIDSFDGDRYAARSRREAPEADGVIYVRSEKPLNIGDYVGVIITGNDAYDLYADAED